MIKNIITLLIFLFGLSLYATELNIDKTQKNKVQFISDAPIESFDGTTKEIDGYLIYDGNDLTKNSDLYFEVDLNTLTTGLGLRDRHMKENYLHTDKHPFTHFTGKVVSAKKNAKIYDVIVKGKIFIHGVEQEKKITGTMEETKNGFHVKCKFEAPLSDYDIEVPSLMFKKIDENMQVILDFYLIKV